VMRLLEGLPGIDVRIVADPTRRADGRATAKDSRE
jgi:hypothetical protein